MRLIPPIEPNVSSSNWALSADVRSPWNIRGLYEAADGRIFRFILAEDANIAQYDVCSYATNYGSATEAESGEVTATDTSDIPSVGLHAGNAPIVAGVAAGAITDGRRGFIQVSGVSYVNTTGPGAGDTASLIAGDYLVANDTPDGDAQIAVAGEEAAIFALAIAAESGDRTLCNLFRIL